MENLKLAEMYKSDMIEINGGAIHPLFWMAAFHVAKEAYNDWDDHHEAFMDGYNS